MRVLRIVANIEAADPAAMAAFYCEVLGLDVVMDHGWIVTVAADSSMRPQLSFAREGGSGTPVPALSIEVDDVDAVCAAVMHACAEVTYPLTAEPWGVRRFFFRDPAGTIVNVLQHASSQNETRD